MIGRAAEATARSRAYDLFGRLFAGGPTAGLLPTVHAIPDLAASLPATLDTDHAAAAHQHLFGFNVFPHESIFLGAGSELGGPVADGVRAFYRRAGYRADASLPAGDHLAGELGLLAFLASAEADAWEDGETGHAERIRALQRDFLDLHLLRWLPPLVQAIRQQAEPFYRALAGLTQDLALDHRSRLGDDLLAPAAPFYLPPLPDLLADKRTGLRDIATHLLTPAYSGLYLSRDDIARLARSGHLPRGFGERRQMLTNLLRSAAEYDSLPRLLADVGLLVGGWRGAYRAFGEQGLPAATGIAAVWLERLAATEALLDQVSRATLASP